MINDLHFITPKGPIKTIEVDLDSIPKEYYGYTDIVVDSLKLLAESAPDLRASVYVYQAPSANFMQLSFSAFIGVAGSREALSLILDAFKAIPGVKARYGDSITKSQSRCEIHIEDGLVWQEADAVSWFSVDNSTEDEDKTVDSEQIDDEEYDYDSDGSTRFYTVYEAGDLLSEAHKHQELVDDDTKKYELNTSPEDMILEKGSDSLPSAPIYTRYRTVRSDARVGSIRTTIEEVFGLPEGSVKLCGPDGAPLRADARIGTLRRRWE
ncbi:hypothetical protein [Vibrio nereis]|uniref:hypothetical protein n=1 Tax=Vibrio nereis TaxID=693 RepID=UPI002494E26B|nr:hypothetical protein [Vibrio nereis]